MSAQLAPLTTLVSRAAHTLHRHKLALAAAFALLVLMRRFKLCCALDQHKDRRLGEPDPSLFPHFFTNRRGLWLHHRRFPVANPRAHLFLVHGYGEHSGRYATLARRFNEIGISVWILDHVGHGMSQGTRAHVVAFQDYLDDYTLFIQRVLAEIRGESGENRADGQESKNETAPKLFLMGHSMGGLIALQLLRYLRKNHSEISFRGAILSSPAIAPDARTASPLNRFLARVFGRCLPKFGIDKLDTRFLSRVEQVCAQFATDPLNYTGAMRARWGQQMLANMDEIAVRAQEITLPTLIVQGEEDRICRPEGAKMIFERLGSEDKQLKLYEGAFHELHFDLCREEEGKDLCEWLEARIERDGNEIGSNGDKNISSNT